MQENKTTRNVCDPCGCVHDLDRGDLDSDIEPGTPSEDHPDYWSGPARGGKDSFSPEE